MSREPREGTQDKGRREGMGTRGRGAGNPPGPWGWCPQAGDLAPRDEETEMSRGQQAVSLGLQGPLQEHLKALIPPRAPPLPHWLPGAGPGPAPAARGRRPLLAPELRKGWESEDLFCRPQVTLDTSPRDEARWARACSSWSLDLGDKARKERPRANRKRRQDNHYSSIQSLQCLKPRPMLCTLRPTAPWYTSTTGLGDPLTPVPH